MISEYSKQVFEEIYKRIYIYTFLPVIVGVAMKRLLMKYRTDQQGLSLVEVLVSFLLLFLLVNYVLSMVILSMTNTSKARHMTAANIYAVSLMEEIRGSLDSIVMSEWLGKTACPADMGLECNENDMAAEINVTSAELGDLYEDLYKVEICIRWCEMGRESDLTIVTILSDE